jgi:DeoR family transcriptional regulator, suf operon transcriptional repressor
MFSLSPESDETLINLLRKQDSAGIGDLEKEMGVTATAIRMRLNRLMADGLVDREVVHQGRGRPSHRYKLTEKGLRAAGDNYADLAEVLWSEIREIEDPSVRNGLLQRIALKLAARSWEAQGEGLVEKMQDLADRMKERHVPLEVDRSGSLPVLTVLACPYPELAMHDREVCTMEQMLISAALGEEVQLTGCRLDGQGCCSFEPSGGTSS